MLHCHSPILAPLRSVTVTAQGLHNHAPCLRQSSFPSVICYPPRGPRWWTSFLAVLVAITGTLKEVYDTIDKISWPTQLLPTILVPALPCSSSWWEYWKHAREDILIGKWMVLIKLCLAQPVTRIHFPRISPTWSYGNYSNHKSWVHQYEWWETQTEG